ERTVAQTSTSDPLKVPEGINSKGIDIPPVTDPHFVIGKGNYDLPAASGTDKGNCLTCPSTPPTVNITEKAPEPPVVKPPSTLRVASIVLSGKAVSLPQPPYPIIAKQAHVQGPVSI